MNSDIKYKLILFNIFIFMFSILLYGCSRDKIELNEISIVMGIGIDKIPGDKPFLVTLEIINPKSAKGDNNTSGKENKSIVKVSTGNSIFDAIQNFSKNNSAILDFSHTKAIIFSKNLCELRVSEVMDYLNRNHQIRSSSWILVANKTAREILESRLPGEDITSRGITNMMNRFRKDPSILPVNLNNFIIESKKESRTSFAPVVELEKSENDASGKITIGKTAIFKNDRLIGILTNEESKNLLWLIDYSKGHMAVSLVKSVKNNENITADVLKISNKIIPHITKDGTNIEIQCTGDAFIREIQNIAVSPEMLEKVEHDIETVLTNQLDELIDKSQKHLNADFVGFSTKIYNNHPKKWMIMKKNWDKTFPNIKYKISFKIKIINIGIIKDSAVSNN
ncbi:Ger(x)C family spore germination protein [Clostridium sp. WILCCON 0269]|uniref:Ger(X)C family spore germination protein n=1 Tax=Candidatus Clostridium eludens TaxID=3381663 RepID=A0ABW8SGZ2_9CLOT